MGCDNHPNSYVLRRIFAPLIVTAHIVGMDEAYIYPATVSARAVSTVEEEQHLITSLDQTTRTLTSQVRQRLLEEALPVFETEGVDAQLIREAFDKRFEEIRLSRMREQLPGLLPEEQRPEFLDPDWDEREDPVPFWVTLVHLLFMAWTVVTAHYPPLFILRWWLKGGLHLGRMQVSQDAERVERSVVLPVCAYLLLIHLYGCEQAPSQGWSLFQFKQRFTETLMQDQVNRVEQKWQRKWNEIKEAA